MVDTASAVASTFFQQSKSSWQVLQLHSQKWDLSWHCHHSTCLASLVSANLFFFNVQLEFQIWFKTVWMNSLLIFAPMHVRTNLFHIRYASSLWAKANMSAYSLFQSTHGLQEVTFLCVQYLNLYSFSYFMLKL